MSTPLGGLIVDILTGAAPVPGGEDEPDTRVRWLFTADLYTHTVWGAAYLEPTSATAALITRAGHLCRSTADTALTDADIAFLWERWNSLSTATRRTGAPLDRRDVLIREAISSTADDALDYLQGNDFGGMEAVAALFTAHTFHPCRAPSLAGAVPPAIAAALGVWDERTRHYRPDRPTTGQSSTDQCTTTSRQEGRRAAHAVA